MKKRFVVFLSLVLTLLIYSSALAGTLTTSGTTSGGTSGTTTCTATMVYGSMWAYAGTDPVKAGTIKASITIYFTTSSGSDFDNRSSTIQNGTSVTSPTANADPGSTVTRMVSGHSYSSTAYGSWSKTLNR